MKYFDVNGHKFDAVNAFPPIDEERIQNALMLAPLNNDEPDKLWLWGWGCYQDSNGVDFWSWEPLTPLWGVDSLDAMIEGMRAYWG